MNANTIRQPTGTAPFYETWYLTCWRPEHKQAVWLRYTLLRQAGKALVGGLWIARFDAEHPERRLAWRQEVPAADIWAPPGGHALRLGTAVFGEGAAHGHLEEEGHRAAWNLRWTCDESLFPIPGYVRALHLDAGLAVADVAGHLDGEISLDGERFTLASAPVTQAHHWGRRYADAWLWGHAHRFENAPDAWVEVLGLRLAAHGWRARPWVLLACRTPVGTWRSAAPWDWLRAQAAYENGRWRFLAPFGRHQLSLEFTAPLDGFLSFPYDSPQGRVYRCHNASLADADLRLYENTPHGARLLGRYQSHGAAAAEFCTHTGATPGTFLF